VPCLSNVTGAFGVQQACSRHLSVADATDLQEKIDSFPHSGLPTYTRPDASSKSASATESRAREAATPAERTRRGPVRRQPRDMAAQIQPGDLPNLTAHAHGLHQPMGVVGLPGLCFLCSDIDTLPEPIRVEPQRAIIHHVAPARRPRSRDHQ
jgi:hypothetical protein